MIIMKLTKHAKKRSQQRGIKNRHVELLLEHGILVNKCYIPKAHLSEIISDYKKRIQDLENIVRANKTLILKQETVITAYNQF